MEEYKKKIFVGLLEESIAVVMEDLEVSFIIFFVSLSYEICFIFKALVKKKFGDDESTSIKILKNTCGWFLNRKVDLNSNSQFKDLFVSHEICNTYTLFIVNTFK